MHSPAAPNGHDVPAAPDVLAASVVAAASAAPDVSAVPAVGETRDGISVGCVGRCCALTCCS